MNNPFQPTATKQRKQAMYRSCYTNPYGETYPNKKPTTRLQDMWNAVGQTQDDDTAIAMVESHGQHVGMGTDETRSVKSAADDSQCRLTRVTRNAPSAGEWIGR